MKSIIKEIFYGNRGNSEKVIQSKKYYDLHEEFLQAYSKLESKLSEENKIILKKICELQESLEIEASDTHFIEGVKIGILLGIEACN